MNNIKALVTIFKRVLYILTNEQKRKAILVLFSMLVCSLLEMLGVSVIYPLLSLMVGDGEVTDSKLSRMLSFLMPNASVKDIVFGMCLVIAALFICKNVVALICVWVQTKYSARCKREIQKLMFESYLRKPYSFFVNNNTGIILRGINGDTTSVYQILLDGFQIIAEMTSIALIGIYLFVSNWIIATFAIILAIVCFLCIVIGFKGKMKRAGKEYIAASGRQFQYSTEAVSGIKEILVMNKGEYFANQYNENAAKVEKATITNNFISACPDRILEAVFVAGFMIAMAFVSYNNDIRQLIPIIGAFAMGAIRILPSISKISSRINSVVYEQIGLENCYNNIMEARRTLEKAKQSTNNYGQADVSFSFKDKLELTDISFSYSDRGEKIFNNMSMIIKKGDAVAFVGQSGAGKTTLADIILGVYSPQRGSIKLDGIEYSKLKGIWSKVIGYVPQSTFLLDDTVRKNVAFGVNEKDIDDKLVWDVLKKAQLAEFVDGLPQKLDTTVGDRGVKFSGGQRQRLSIARALYNKPDILILDEATSALDNDTEAAVMEAIESLRGYHTLIIVAHRLSTVRNCNKIYEIGNGKAYERSWESLFMHEAN